jgi:lysyl-tRNA synthetase class 2
MKPQNLKNIILRQKIISAIRQFFVQKKFQEIDLPVLKYSLPLEQNIYSLETSCMQIQDKLYLSTSPESGLKKIISQRPGNYFSISPSFRNLEAKGPTHQPEFLMLEWYQTNSDYLRTMKITQNLIFYIAQGLDNIKYNRTNNILTYQNYKFNLSLPWPKISIKQLFLDYANIDLDIFLTSSKFSENNFNQIFLNDIEPHLSTSHPTFITDYPAYLSPLAQKKSNSLYSKRFELYFGPLEIANGNTENNSIGEITSASLLEEKHRRLHQLPAAPIDYDFVKASSKMSHIAGCGLGIDRLAMLLTNSTHINSVRPFSL